MSAHALLPCPFCGGPVELEQTVDGRHWWGVVCRNTRNVGGICAIHQIPSASEEAAVTRWNTRANPWKAAIDEALIVSCLDCISPNDEPEATLARLVSWEVSVTLDPAVSQAAADLIERGKALAAPAASAIEFALTAEEGLEFLRAWQHGDWEVIRREWPEAPVSVFVSP